MGKEKNIIQMPAKLVKKRIAPKVVNVEKLQEGMIDTLESTCTIKTWKDIDDMIDNVEFTKNKVTIHWVNMEITEVSFNGNKELALSKALLKWICGNSDDYTNLEKYCK